MATKYHLFVDETEVTEATRAKKQPVIQIGEATGKPFQVRTDNGTVVHSHLVAVEAPTVEDDDDIIGDVQHDAPAPAQPKATRKEQPQVDGPVITYTGTKLYFKPLAEGIQEKLAKRKIDVAIDYAGMTMTVSDPTVVAEIGTRFEKTMDAFKEWKTKNRERRAEQHKTNEGRSAKLREELEFVRYKVASVRV